MPQRPYEEQQNLIDLYEKLAEAEEQSRAGKTILFRQVMLELRSQIDYILYDNVTTALCLADDIEEYDFSQSRKNPYTKKLKQQKKK